MKNTLQVLTFLAAAALAPTIADAKPQVKASQAEKAQTTSKTQPVIKRKHTSSHEPVWLYSADATLKQDLDNDGYFQQLKLTVDFDTIYQSQDVYFKFYLNSTSIEQFDIYTSDVIHLNQDSDQDTQQFEFQFSEDLPHNEYQLVIDVFDATTEQFIYSTTQYLGDELDLLPLEASNLDSHDVISIYRTELTLNRDNDSDGYYESFEIVLDADTSSYSTRVFAEIYLGGQLLYQSNSFTLYGDSTTDTQYFDIELASGYYPSYYDLEINIVSEQSYSVLHHILSDNWVELANLPLESNDYVYDDIPDSSSTVIVTHSSGSLTGILYFLASICALRIIMRNKLA